ncbi:alpha/beta hydrolase [Allokutzneria oryzae]|uniref:Acyl-CoA:diacylglycerol acyltransferase n=1 Tax=Allokutzneria oryzae TaxID=1378989 RepID=A0ABV6A824_9PSEU
MAQGGISQRSAVTRRTVLISAAAGAAATVTLGVGASSGVLRPAEKGLKPVATLPSTTPALASLPSRGVMRVERVRSTYRRQNVEIATFLPSVTSGNLPVCLLLHGRFGNARSAPGGDLAGALANAVNKGHVRPFAFVAVDGGANTYWHQQQNDNPMAMLLEEVPRWLVERGLGGPDGVPFAVSGISMGGFGAFLYARRRLEQRNPVRAIAAVSPALITSWGEMSKRRAFRDQAEWASMDPLRNIDKHGAAKVGMWCGTEDSFIGGVRQFIQRAKPAVAATGPGGHNHAFYNRVLPDVVRFVGRNLP